ncbi:MAG: VWA domain-containing protein [Chitinophagaceae bacterium]|nr:VWA domain-containing protein [Oligoflexus sp.]
MLFRSRGTLSGLVSLVLVAATLNGCKTTSFNGQADTRTLAPRKTSPASPAMVTPDTLPKPAVIVSTVETKKDSLAVPTPPTPLTPEAPPEPAVDYQVKTESFVQTSVSGRLDILIVMDNSGSMANDQKNLSTKIGALLKDLNNVDWQIGVVTTTVKNDTCQLSLIKSTDSDVETKFAKAIQVGTSGSDNEEGIRQAYNGLRCTETPWVRDNSTVAVLIVSDEDNCSNGYGCKTGAHANSFNEHYVIDYVEKTMNRTVGVNAGFYGIFWPAAQVCRQASNRAVIYQRLTDYKANGQINYGSICDGSYQYTLEKMSTSMAKLLTNRFKLGSVPNANSVIVTGQKAGAAPIEATDYTIEGDTIIFKFGSEPIIDSKVEITYHIPLK